MSEKPQERRQTKIIRFMNNDMNDSLSVFKALRKMKGIGTSFVKTLCRINNIDKSKSFGELSQEELKMLEDGIRNPQMPNWMLNRPKDPATGDDIHIIGANIDLVKREDINTLRRIRAYRGIRHEQGQPVRGQRTRSTFRVNKTVGVRKKDTKR